MASLPDKIVANSTLALSVLLAMPLVVYGLREIYPNFRSMNAGTAVVVFGVVGGASGVVSQGVAARQLEKVNTGPGSRGLNVLELLPAVAASVFASGLATYALLPPNPNPATLLLSEAGEIPS